MLGRTFPYRLRTQFCAGLADDLQAAPDTQGRHDQRDSKIRPGGACANNAGGSEQDREIADRVVARAEPDRAQVVVAAPVAIEHERTAAVVALGHHAYATHGLSARHNI